MNIKYNFRQLMKKITLLLSALLILNFATFVYPQEEVASDQTPNLESESQEETQDDQGSIQAQSQRLIKEIEIVGNKAISDSIIMLLCYQFLDVRNNLRLPL